MGVADDIRQQYPNLYFLMQDPEIGPLLREAVDPNAGFSAQAFYAKLTNTRWWKSRSQAQRQWEFMRHTDPAEAQSQINQFRNQLSQQASRLGIALTPSQLAIISVDALSKGLSPDSPEVLRKMIQLRTLKNTQAGGIQTASRQAMAVSYGDYFLPMSGHTAGIWGQQIATGMKTLDDLRVEMQKKAISRFPYLRTQIMAGQTPAEIFAPHRDMIASELELSPGTIDLANSKWSKVLDYYDKTTKVHRPMTLYEVQTLARQDDRWWKTQKGKSADASMANMILERFGKRKV